VFVCLNLNGGSLFSVLNEGSLIVFGPILNIRSAYRGRFSIAWMRLYGSLTSFCDVDVPEALADIDVNRRDTDASRSDKL
jgi:hypothetical protein